MQGLLHAGFSGDAITDLATAVIFTIRDDRPTVVFAGLRLVDLVATLRAVLMRPQCSVRRQRRALRVAVAVAPDFGLGTRPY